MYICRNIRQERLKIIPSFIISSECNVSCNNSAPQLNKYKVHNQYQGISFLLVLVTISRQTTAHVRLNAAPPPIVSKISVGNTVTLIVCLPRSGNVAYVKKKTTKLRILI